MQTTTIEIAEKAKRLPDNEKLELVNQLLEQLDHPDPEIDRVWADEARRRIKACQEGRIKAIPYSEVMAKYQHP
jgi:putative addiction module component (TIGR02574 family)